MAADARIPSVAHNARAHARTHARTREHGRVSGAYSKIVNPCPAVTGYLADLINVFTSGGLEVSVRYCEYPPVPRGTVDRPHPHAQTAALGRPPLRRRRTHLLFSRRMPHERQRQTRSLVARHPNRPHAASWHVTTHTRTQLNHAHEPHAHAYAHTMWRTRCGVCRTRTRSATTRSRAPASSAAHSFVPQTTYPTHPCTPTHSTLPAAYFLRTHPPFESLSHP